MSQTRRLAAILASDVAGYSRLVGADEEGALERLKALRREPVDPKIAEHRGRAAKTTGYGKTYHLTKVRGITRSRCRRPASSGTRSTGSCSCRGYAWRPARPADIRRELFSLR